MFFAVRLVQRVYNPFISNTSSHVLEEDRMNQVWIRVTKINRKKGLSAGGGGRRSHVLLASSH